jgi:MinD-like ATPase involved in chromosome partitioning or flagellar assembly
MSKKEVEGALDMKVAFEIPSDRAVPVSVNRGNPAVLGDAGSEFSGAIKRLAHGIVTPTPNAARKAKKGLFSLAKA